jgi:hypothetical protein
MPATITLIAAIGRVLLPTQHLADFQADDQQSRIDPWRRLARLQRELCAGNCFAADDNGRECAADCNDEISSGQHFGGNKLVITLRQPDKRRDAQRQQGC